MNKKGQALVEFIIILPILLIVILAVFDYVKIVNTKIVLEDTLDSYLINEEISLDEDITIKKEDNTYYISKNVEITSPFLVPIISNNYNVLVKRVYNE